MPEHDSSSISVHCFHFIFERDDEVEENMAKIFRKTYKSTKNNFLKAIAQKRFVNHKNVTTCSLK